MARPLQGMLAIVLVSALVGLLGTWHTVADVQAHDGDEGEIQILGERVDGYDVTVRTKPKPPRVGRLHVEVQLIAPEDLTYVQGATLTATARFRGNEAEEVGPARARYQEPWHEVDLDLKKSGPWEVLLVIDGPRGQAQTSFPIEVQPGQRSAGLNLRWVFAATIPLAGLVVMLYRRSRRRSARPSW